MVFQSQQFLLSSSLSLSIIYRVPHAPGICDSCSPVLAHVFPGVVFPSPGTESLLAVLTIRYCSSIRGGLHRVYEVGRVFRLSLCRVAKLVGLVSKAIIRRCPCGSPRGGSRPVLMSLTKPKCNDPVMPGTSMSKPSNHQVLSKIALKQPINRPIPPISGSIPRSQFRRTNQPPKRSALP